MQDSTFIGLDIHKATISVPIAQGERGEKCAIGEGSQIGGSVAKIYFGWERLLATPEGWRKCQTGIHRQVTLS